MTKPIKQVEEIKKEKRDLWLRSEGYKYQAKHGIFLFLSDGTIQPL